MSDLFNDEVYIQKLVKDVQNGNKDAFGKLWETVKFYVFNLMEIKIGETDKTDQEISERLTNEVGSKLYEKIPGYQPREGVKFITWLRALATNVKCDYFRQRPKADDPVPEVSLEADPKLPDEVASRQAKGKTPAEIVENQDTQRRYEQIFSEVLALLPEIERFVVIHKVYENHSYKKISYLLHGDERKAEWYRTTVFPRAIKMLTDILREKGYLNELKFLMEE